MQTKLLLCIIALFFFAFTPPSTLKIEITDLKNSEGQILLEFSDSEKNVLKEIAQDIKNNSCIIEITDLQAGSYSFKYFHDANKDKKLNTNFVGMPKEGFGFSNNAKGKFGPPGHEKTIFAIKGDTTLHCTPIYLKK